MERIDLNTAAFRIVQQAVGDSKRKVVAKQKAGRSGGAARANSLSPERRTEIAHAASQARWAKRQA